MSKKLNNITIKMTTEKKVKLEYLVLNEELRNKFLSLPQIDSKIVRKNTWYPLFLLEREDETNYLYGNVGFCYRKNNKKLIHLHKFLTSLTTEGELPEDIAINLELIDSYKIKRIKNHLIIQLSTDQNPIYLIANINKFPIDKEKQLTDFLCNTP